MESRNERCGDYLMKMKMKMIHKPSPVVLKITFKDYDDLREFSSTMGIVADYVDEEIRRGKLDDSLGSREKKAVVKELESFNEALNDAWELPEWMRRN